MIYAIIKIEKEIYMARHYQEVETNLTEKQLEKKIADFITIDGYRAVNYKSEANVYKKGYGLIAAPQYVKLEIQDNKIIIQAWIKPFIVIKESSLKGFLGIVPKKALKASLVRFITTLDY